MGISDNDAGRGRAGDAEKRDPHAPAADQSSAIAQCGIARTKDLITWERLANLRTSSPQQRNVLHPEFVDGNMLSTPGRRTVSSTLAAEVGSVSGWLHIAHGVRNTAAGLRYTLYLFMTDLEDLTRVTHKPARYYIAPRGEERVGGCIECSILEWLDRRS